MLFVGQPAAFSIAGQAFLRQVVPTALDPGFEIFSEATRAQHPEEKRSFQLIIRKGVYSLGST